MVYSLLMLSSASCFELDGAFSCEFLDVADDVHVHRHSRHQNHDVGEKRKWLVS